MLLRFDDDRHWLRVAARLVGHLFPNWLRQRIEAIIWMLKQLRLERYGGRVPVGLWARIVQRLLVLNTCIWHNWLIGASVKRSLSAYDHVST